VYVKEESSLPRAGNLAFPLLEEAIPGQDNRFDIFHLISQRAGAGDGRAVPVCQR